MATPYDLFSTPAAGPANPFERVGVQAPQPQPLPPVPMAAPQLTVPGAETPPPVTPPQIQVPGSEPATTTPPEIDLDSIIMPMIAEGIPNPVKYDPKITLQYLTPQEAQQYGLINPKTERPLAGEGATVFPKGEKELMIKKAQLPAEIVKVKDFKEFDNLKENLRLSEDEILAPFPDKLKPFMAIIAARESNFGKYRVHKMIDNGGMHDGARSVSSFGVMPVSAIDIAKKKFPDEVYEKFPELKEMKEMPREVEYGSYGKTTYTNEDQLKVAKMVGNNPELDAYLAKAIFDDKVRKAKKAGIEGENAKVIFGLAAYYMGEDNAAKLYKEAGFRGLAESEYIQDIVNDHKNNKGLQKYESGFKTILKKALREEIN